MQTIVIPDCLLCNWPDHLIDPDHHLQKRIVTPRRSSFTTGWPIIGIICKSKIVLTLRCFLRRWQTVCPRLTTSIPPCLCTTPTVSVEVRNNSSVQISTKLSTCCEENQKQKSPGGMMSPHTPLTHHPHHPHHPHGPPMAMSDADTGLFPLQS